MHFAIFFPHSVAKEMAIILNLQHAKDYIEIIFIFVVKNSVINNYQVTMLNYWHSLGTK